jgi:hypothetical protein
MKQVSSFGVSYVQRPPTRKRTLKKLKSYHNSEVAFSGRFLQACLARRTISYGLIPNTAKKRKRKEGIFKDSWYMGKFKSARQ